MKTKKILVQDIQELQARTKTIYTNKYYNIFMNSYTISEVGPEANDYVFKKFYGEGTLAAFKIRNTDEIGFAPYAIQSWNMYDLPVDVQFINRWNSPLVPTGTHTVGVDAVVGWIQPNHKPIKMIVDYYIDRMVAVDMVINTNLQVHKLPFVIGITPEDEDRARDVVQRILNNEPVIFADLEQLAQVKSFATATPYIIDKLYNYRTSLENELLTFLGVDNAMSDDTKDRLIVDQVDANSAQINANQQAMLTQLQNFVDTINEVFGASLSVKCNNEISKSVHETGNGSGMSEDNKKGGNK